MTIAHWPTWFEHCGCMQHTCLPNASPNHVIQLIGWCDQTCYQSASSRATETTFLTRKCFSVENLIIVSLNLYWNTNPCYCLAYRRLLDVSINRLFIIIQCLLLFNVVFQVMHKAYWHKPDFSVMMCLSRQVDSFVSRLRRQCLELLQTQLALHKEFCPNFVQMTFVCLFWFFTSQSTILQSCLDWSSCVETILI